MMRNKKAWNSTATTDDDSESEGTDTTDVATADANELAGSTMISLGYHREGIQVDCRKDEKTDPEGFSDVGVTVASAAFVLAGVALSTIPAALL